MVLVKPIKSEWKTIILNSVKNKADYMEQDFRFPLSSHKKWNTLGWSGKTSSKINSSYKGNKTLKYVTDIVTCEFLRSNFNSPLLIILWADHKILFYVKFKQSTQAWQHHWCSQRCTNLIVILAEEQHTVLMWLCCMCVSVCLYFNAWLGRYWLFFHHFTLPTSHLLLADRHR